VPRPLRITEALLDVAECLLRALEEGGAVHGWDLVKQTRRSGPTIYGLLDRLEGCSWITGRWEELSPEHSRPRRRLYRLTPEGEAGVQVLLEERRPQTLTGIRDGHLPGGTVPGPQAYPGEGI
jgi:PadR family transcriptional regulator PadR